MYLDASSKFKGVSDLLKYEKARELKKHIGKIRKHYWANMDNTDMQQRQLAVATWVIDILALRVGNEKDTNDRADTVGCCSLRVEHIQFPKENTIKLYFLGKDSMVYDNTVEIPPKVFQNFKSFAKGKKPNGDLFCKVKPGDLNEHLKTFMDDLSAKVFRTYNASVTMEKQLHEVEENSISVKARDSMSELQKSVVYNRANREVAILCNHQRSVPKAHEAQLEKMQDKRDQYAAQVKELTEHAKFLKSGKKNKKASASNLPSSLDACKSKLARAQTLVCPRKQFCTPSF